MDDPAQTPTLPTPAQVQAARDALRSALTGLRPQVTMERDGLVLIALEPTTPAHDAPGSVLPYLLFEQAVADGAVEVHEIGTGSVPSVAATTKGQPVVIFAGDTITGGKQNRVINISVWLPAGKVTELPVTCLELGRWDPGVAARFGAGRKADYALRSMLSHQVGEQRRRSAEFAAPGAPAPRSHLADQGEVWAEIGRRETRAGRRSNSRRSARPAGCSPSCAAPASCALAGRIMLTTWQHFCPASGSASTSRRAGSASRASPRNPSEPGSSR